MRLAEIKRTIADNIIKTNHYTHKVCTGTKYSLGVWVDGEIKGVVQLGKGIHKINAWVEGSTHNEWLEVNRNWLSDELPHNSESKVWGMVFKWLREHHPEIKWLITFANGISGHVGTQYQATNWIYTGYNTKGGFWVTKDGEMIHPLTLHSKGIGTKRKEVEEVYGTPLYRVKCGQFRYFYFLDKSYQPKLKLQQLPYPKQTDLENIVEVFTEDWQLPQPLWGEVRELITKRK